VRLQAANSTRWPAANGTLERIEQDLDLIITESGTGAPREEVRRIYNENQADIVNSILELGDSRDQDGNVSVSSIGFVAEQARVDRFTARRALEHNEWNTGDAILELVNMHVPDHSARIAAGLPRPASLRQGGRRPYVVLAVGTENNRPSERVRQQLIDSRRRRFKGPTTEFMTLADEAQELLPDGTYLKMANAAKKMYEVIEELDPTTVEGYKVQAGDEGYEPHEQRIAQLEERNIELSRDLEHAEELVRSKGTMIAELSNEVNVHIRKEIEAIKESQAAQALVKALENHTIIGRHIAHFRAVSMIATGVDEGKRKLINSSFMAMRETAKHPYYTIETVNYPKTEFTEGFGALGFTLDDTDALWAMWAPDME